MKIKPYQADLFNNPFSNCSRCCDKNHCKASILPRDVVVCLGPYRNLKHKNSKIKKIFLNL
jgi:hypothetical protein